MVECGFGDGFDVRLEREGGVQKDTQVADFGRSEEEIYNLVQQHTTMDLLLSFE